MRTGTFGAWAVIALLVLACGGSSAGHASPTPSPAPTAASSPAVTPFPTATAPDGIGPADLAPVGPTETARVVRIVDGDTIIVGRGQGEESVRYIGIDTPETVAPGRSVDWMGPEASAANAELVEGREVILERDVSETDSFGRLLRYVWIADPANGARLVMVNLELVARGYAAVATYPPDVRYVDLFLAAQTTARDAELGLWGQTASASGDPVPAPLSVEVTAVTESVRPNDQASVTIQTMTGADCTITVTYSSGPSTAAGLDPQQTDADGSITWTWNVGGRTASGAYPIVVWCQLGERTGDVQAGFTVR